MAKSRKSPRHSPAFILLFVARGQYHGGAILKMMEEEIPYFLGDSSMVYRILQELEEVGDITSEWETPESGRPIRKYRITDKGLNTLLEAEDDIRRRIDNHLFFLKELEKEKDKRNFERS